MQPLTSCGNFPLSVFVTGEWDAYILLWGTAMDDKVKIRCPACTKVFREKAARVRDGFQVNCANCNKLLTLSKESEDPFFRRALKTAREIRAAREAELFAATYAGAGSAPRRETP